MRLCGAKVEKAEPIPIDLALSVSELIHMDLPAREPIIEGFLYKPSLAQMFGWRGIGKTWAGMYLAQQIAKGQRFLEWNVPQARRVLYVDGEMAGNELRERCRLLTGNNDPPDYFMLLPAELFQRRMDYSLNIVNPLHQSRFEDFLAALKAEARDPEVIFFDNISALTHGIDEQSSTEFGPVKEWFKRLRLMGYTVVFLHHAGKEGRQRGTSGREDNLDLSIQLEGPERPTLPTSFKLVLDKSRGIPPTPSEVQVTLMTDECNALVLATNIKPKVPIMSSERSQAEHILKFIVQNDGKLTRTDVQKHFELAKPTSNRQVEKLVKERLVSGGAGALNSTEAGRRRVFELWPEAAEL
jgi:hypothetical protein